MNYKVVLYACAFTEIVPFLLALFMCKKIVHYNPYILYLVVFQVFLELVNITLLNLHIRTLETVLILGLAEGIIVPLLFFKSTKKIVYQNIIKSLIPTYFIGSACIYFALDKDQFFPTFTPVFQQTVLIIPVIIFFIERMELVDDLYILNNPMFWISSGLLLFYSVSIFYFGIRNYLHQHHPDIEKNGYFIQSFLLVILNILFTKAIWKIRKI